MAIKLNSAEQAYVAYHRKRAESGEHTITPEERTVITRIAREYRAGRTVGVRDKSVFAEVGGCLTSRCRQLIALGKAYAAGVEQFVGSKGTLTLGETMGMRSFISGREIGGPLETSGGLFRVPFELTYPNGKKRITYININAGWNDTLDSIRNRAFEIIREIIDEGTDIKVRSLL